MYKQYEITIIGNNMLPHLSIGLSKTAEWRHQSTSRWMCTSNYCYQKGCVSVCLNFTTSKSWRK